jgi:hypothetical protein
VVAHESPSNTVAFGPMEYTSENLLLFRMSLAVLFWLVRVDGLAYYSRLDKPLQVAVYTYAPKGRIFSIDRISLRAHLHTYASISSALSIMP